jgi:polysaccharide biosynthesis protein PslG
MMRAVIPFAALVAVASVATAAPTTSTTTGTTTTGTTTTPPPPEPARVPPAKSPIASIQDDRLSYSTMSAEVRVRQMVELGTRLIRTDLPWDYVAKSRPTDAKDQNDPAYDWTRMDQIVAAANKYKVKLLFTVWGTPIWAKDPKVTDSPFWERAIRPANPAEFGDFAIAAATRYAPRGVHMWEAWNEPNLPLFLVPQFERKAGKWVNVSAKTYSALAKSFWTGVKEVDPTATIGGLVTAPVGNPCPAFCPDEPNERTYPIDFLRLLDAPGLRPPMDAVSHHPYPQTGPRSYDFPGATYVDLYNLSRLEKAVDASYLKGKPIWLTEVGFSTAPTQNYSTYFSKAKQAEYLADAYRRVRENPRIKILTWFFLQDNRDWTSGLLTIKGAKKPAYGAFAFPVSPDLRKTVPAGTPITILGQIRIAAAAGPVTIQREVSGAWKNLAVVKSTADGGFSAVVRPTETGRYRATWSGRSRLRAKEVRVSEPFTLRVLRGS